MLGRASAFAVSLLLFLSSASPSRAQDEVEVRGGNAGGFVSRASIEDSAREITDAASLIEPLPGVHVRRLGADDSFATLSVRGTSSTQVAVVLAGVPLSGGADPTLDLATLPLWPGAKARVYRSFAPAALGRGSLGGTLVLDAPSPRAESSTEVYAAAGAYGSRRIRVGDVSGAPDGIRIATGLSASRSDDDFSYLDPHASTNDNHVYRTRQNAGHDAASGLASIAIPIHLEAGKSGALTITTLAQVRHQELPGTIERTTVDQSLDSNRVLGALELTLPAGPGAFIARTWARREGLVEHDDPTEAVIIGGTASHTDDAIVGVGGATGWKGRPSERTTLDARIDASGERFAPGTWVSAPQPPGATRASVGAGADFTYRLLDPLTLAAAARADAWFDDADDGTSHQEARPTGNIGAEFVRGPVSLATHGGFTARPASFVELYGDRGAFVGNPLLAPESARTIDLGGTFAKRLGPLHVHLELAGFATWATDLITFLPVGAYGRAMATNIGRARIFGLESALRLAAYGFEVRISDTALDTANETQCHLVGATCERPQLFGRPANDFVGDVLYTIGPLRARYGVDVVTGIWVDNIETIRVPARALHSVGAQLEVPGVRGLVLALDVRNLFDLRAASYSGFLGGTVPYPIGDLYDYPLPGRRLLLSARWVFPVPSAGASFRGPQ